VALFVDSQNRAPACDLRVRLSPQPAGDYVLPAFAPV
jgi:hypothetical protein